MRQQAQQIPFVVGAYASMPADKDGQSQYYQLLGEQSWIAGTELPYPGDLADTSTRTWLAHALPKHWHTNTVTAIPGTMQHVWKDGTFGLASPDEQGRTAAIQWLQTLRDAVEDVAQLRASSDIAAIEIHSAPTELADASAFQRSLEEVCAWNWSGAQLVIEHCDRYIAEQKPEKGFLSIDQEIAVAQQLGIGITVNWGRSAVEGRDALTPQQHVEAAATAGVLQGLMFSGAGPEETQYGYSWIDGHLPMNVDEPSSLMDTERIQACTRIAIDQAESLQYLGAKICVPKDATLATRLSFLQHIHDAVIAA